MQYSKFVIDEDPYVIWDHDIQSLNLELLNGINLSYFELPLLAL